MINSNLAQTPRNANQPPGLVSTPGFSPQANSNSAAPPADSRSVSAEAFGPEAEIEGMRNALTATYQPEESEEGAEASEDTEAEEAKAEKIAELEEKIAAVEKEITKARQANDQEATEELGDQLQSLQTQLADLRGADGQPADQAQDGSQPSPEPSDSVAAYGDSGGGAPSGGSGAPSGAGGAPSGGGGASSGGGGASSGGGGTPSGGGGAPGPSGGGGGVAPAGYSGGGGGGSAAGAPPHPFPLDSSYSAENASPGVAAMLERAGSMEGMHENTHTAAIQQITGKTGINPATTPWCAAWAMNLMRDHGVLDLDGLKNPNYCPEIKNWAGSKGNYGQAGKYNPKPGDAILFDWQRNGETDHIGIVEKVVDGKVYTIEGNSGDAVRRKSYPLNSGVIDGYVKGKNDAAQSKPAPPPRPAVAV